MIQHLEGGIIKQINAREGDHVKAGQPLLTLDSTIAEAQLNRMLKQLAALRAKSKRLEAERDLKEKLEIPDDIVPARAASASTTSSPNSRSSSPPAMRATSPSVRS